MMIRTIAFAAIGAAVTQAVSAAGAPALTIYRADGDALFDNGSAPVSDGYAVVHEERDVSLAGGRSTVVIDGLPATLDPDAVAIDLGGKAQVIAQRVLSSGQSGALAAHRGQAITVTLRDGSAVHGTLLGVDDGSLIVREDAGAGVVYLRDFASVRFASGSGLPGSTLQLVVDGGGGTTAAALDYPTSGIGWRAAYSATLLAGDACRLRLDALASIANRTGRDFPDASLKLVAGSPNIASGGGPRPYAMKAMAAAPAPPPMPQQSQFGDYRSYAIPGTLSLPDASVTQVPLYAAEDLDCERHWIVENGGSWFPPKPQLVKGDVRASHEQVASRLRFSSERNLPAGNLRVLMRDKDRSELLGESRIGDTPKGETVDVTLGTAFDLRAERERTSFDVDRAARTMKEGFRITLTNTGDTARTIDVREHPNRWREWSLASSSQPPGTKKPDLLAFKVAVPANGKAVLDYVVQYRWTAADE